MITNLMRFVDPNYVPIIAFLCTVSYMDKPDNGTVIKSGVPKRSAGRSSCVGPDGAHSKRHKRSERLGTFFTRHRRYADPHQSLPSFFSAFHFLRSHYRSQHLVLRAT